MRATITLALTSFALAACADRAAAPTAPAARPDRAPSPDASGAVYTMTNGAGGNAILVFRRAPGGSLTAAGSVATGGTGTGGTIDPLVSQYAVLLSADNRTLYAVNAGSDDVSAFRVGGDGAITLTDRVPSGGDLPVSIAAHGDLVYVLNAGDNTVSGFRSAGRSGRLVPIPGSTRPLGAGAAGAAAVRFTADGGYLVVTERVSSRIETFAVLPNGRLGEPVATASRGSAPFGFDVTPRNQIVVSETAGAAPNGAASSYALGASGTLASVTASLSSGGRAACWAIVTADGRFAYVTNAGSNNVAGYAVSESGALSRLTPGGPTAVTGDASTPIDLDLAAADRLLYILEASTGNIAAFIVNADGTLAALPDTPAGAPASGLQGIAAF